MKHRRATLRLGILATAALLLPLLAAGGDPVDVTGTWTMEVQTAMGSGQPTFTLKQEEKAITGTYEGFFGKVPATGQAGEVRVIFTCTIPVASTRSS